MRYKKIFFPIGGGGELRERIRGALLIAKYLNAHIEIFKATATPSQIMKIEESLPDTVLKELNEIAMEKLEESLQEHEAIFTEEAKSLKIEISKLSLPGKTTATTYNKNGYRSKLIENESKYCDLVAVSSPHNSTITATFETAITKSGKPAIMFPRKMENFRTDKILIGWNNSPEIARSLSDSIPLLKKAKKVHLITSERYIKDFSKIDRIETYLKMHDIQMSYEIVKTTQTPGEALLSYAINKKYDLIVAGAFGNRGLKEIMFGGTTNYILKHSSIPIFMAH